MIEPIGIAPTSALGRPEVGLELVLTTAAPHKGAPDLGEIVDCFSNEYRFDRYSEETVTNADGYPVTASGPGSFVALAHIWYATNRTAERLSQGRTVGARIEIHTTTVLRVDETEAGRVHGDRVHFDGRLFLIDEAGNRYANEDGSYSYGIYFGREVNPTP